MAAKPGASAAISPVPGIIYSPIEQRARLAGTGIDVFEVVKTFRSVGESRERLQAAYDWLTADQLRAALAFYELNRDFVEESLEQDEDDVLAEFWTAYPQSRPPRR